MSDAQKYRTKEEVEEYRKIDPITQVKDVILKNKYAPQKRLDEIDAKVKAAVAECQKFAGGISIPRKICHV